MIYEGRATTNVPSRPQCDICKHLGEVPKLAAVDGKTREGPWAYLCENHFNRFGVGLGMGVGQVLICSDDLDTGLVERLLS